MENRIAAPHGGINVARQRHAAIEQANAFVKGSEVFALTGGEIVENANLVILGQKPGDKMRSFRSRELHYCLLV